jgi:formylglycine-generating enzyme required for sulfatase activity
MLTRRGEVKLLDFGVAKLIGQTGLTQTGQTLGTIAYMAPEQVNGGGADERTDIWSLGVVLYEMLAGRPPFSGDNALAVLNAVANTEPPAIEMACPGLPSGVAGVVRNAMQRSRERRYASAHDLLSDLERCSPAAAAQTATVTQAPTAPAPAVHAPRSRRARMLAPALAALLIFAIVAAWWWRAESRLRGARAQLATIATMIQQEDNAAAYRLLRELEPLLAGDPAFEAHKNNLLMPFSLTTTPPGAELELKGYDEPNADWMRLGTSPITDGRGAPAYFRWRVSKPGFATFEGADEFGMAELNFALQREGTIPERMVHVPGRPVSLPGGASVELPDFFLDKFEVTNREFKRFVDAGGYGRREFWQEPFLEGGREVSADDAFKRFRDATGRPGPATWELGAYPPGQDEFPVGGISWYEAAAYARFVGKQLPTAHHWLRAAAFGINSDIVRHSNFSGKAVARVGAYPGLGAFGTYDMAGNVKEWCWNAQDDKRYTMGGAWNEPVYLFREPASVSPFDRSPTNGLRLVTPKNAAPLPEPLLAPIRWLARDYSRETPASDETFKLFAGLYAYDPAPLAAKVESTDESHEHWRRERVSFAAAYGEERIPAYLFLPRRAKPPFQTVVYFPHSGGTLLRSFEPSEMVYLGFIVKAGRALLVPMYRGTYERRLATAPAGPAARRDLLLQQMKDLRRAVDYLESTTPSPSPRRRNRCSACSGPPRRTSGTCCTTAGTSFRSPVSSRTRWTGWTRISGRHPEEKTAAFLRPSTLLEVSASRAAQLHLAEGEDRVRAGLAPLRRLREEVLRVSSEAEVPR